MGSRSTTALGENILKINRSVEAQPAIRKDINPVTLVITRRVENRNLNGRLAPSQKQREKSRQGKEKGKTHITSLNKVPSNK